MRFGFQHFPSVHLEDALRLSSAGTSLAIVLRWDAEPCLGVIRFCVTVLVRQKRLGVSQTRSGVPN